MSVTHITVAQRAPDTSDPYMHRADALVLARIIDVYGLPRLLAQLGRHAPSRGIDRALFNLSIRASQLA